MNDKNAASLTQEEKRTAQLAVMRATLAALGALPKLEDQSIPEMAGRVYSAFVAAYDASLYETNRLTNEKGRRIYPSDIEAQADQVVATMYWYWIGVQRTAINLEDVSINSQAGFELLAFAQGIAAAKMVEMAERALAIDDTEGFAPYPPANDSLVSAARSNFERLKQESSDVVSLMNMKAAAHELMGRLDAKAPGSK